MSAVADAKPVCIQTPGAPTRYMRLTTFSPSKGKVKQVLGTNQHGIAVNGVVGTVVVSANGQRIGIGLTEHSASVGNTASGASTGTEFMSMVIVKPNGKLEVGHTLELCQWSNNGGVVFDQGCDFSGALVIDCATIPPLP